MLRKTNLSFMKVCVGVKRVVDYTVKVRVKDNAVVTENVKMSINPFDEIAVEEAVRLKEKKIATDIIAVTIGPKKSEDVLRTALALGCTQAIHITCSDQEAAALEPLAIAQVFAKLSEDIKPDLWLLGKQAIDGDYGMTTQMLAGLLNAPQGTYASEIKVSDDKKSVQVTREIDSGRQIVELAVPCVLAADLRLNVPRFASLPNIMKARKVKIDCKDLKSFGVDTAARLETVKVETPPARQAGIVVKDVDELMDKLKNEAKCI